MTLLQGSNQASKTVDLDSSVQEVEERNGLLFEVREEK